MSINRFDLNHAALRLLPRLRFALLHLLGRVQAKIGMANALIGQLLNAEHRGPQRTAYGVQQVGQGHARDFSSFAPPDVRTKRRWLKYTSTSVIALLFAIVSSSYLLR